jgi:hypothetical protein
MSDAEITAPLAVDQPTPEELIQGRARKERLGAWYATAICGNDITSSCLYVSAIAIVYAHAMAPLALLLAAGVLYLYRRIYTEVVEALPLELDIPRNMMFMGSLTHTQTFSIQDLGGVRIIW